MKLKVVLGLAAVVALAPMSAYSQSVSLTEDSLVAQCLATPDAAGATAPTCSALFAAYIEQLRAAGLSPLEIDDLIASAVVQLSAAAISDPVVRANVAAAIRAAAAQISDADRAVRVASIADVVESGQGFQTAAIDPVLASDN